MIQLKNFCVSLKEFKHEVKIQKGGGVFIPMLAMSESQANEFIKLHNLEMFFTYIVTIEKGKRQ